MIYSAGLTQILRSDEFDEWLHKLRDDRARARILRLSLGNAGDVKSVGEGVREMRRSSRPH